MKTVRPMIVVLFVAHVVLLLLASTRFTLISSIVGNDALNWNYFQYSYQNGWGYAYKSAYTAAQVVAYFVAYTLGLPVFLDAFRRGSLFIGGIGALLCATGVLSFVIEGSHWLFAHNLSWIASFPLVMAVLWLCWVALWLLDARSTSETRRQRPV